MLSLRKIVLFMLSASVIIIVLGWTFAFLEAILVLILLLTNLGMLALGALYICSDLYVKTHCRGKGGKKQIALTFDDGPHPEHTAELLGILSHHNIKVAFFLKGTTVKDNAILVRRMAEEGHIIGNHSYSHPYHFGFLSTKAVTGELQQCHAAIREITGLECKWFRPPFGVTNPHIAKAVQSMGYQVVGWSIRSLDTMTKDPERTIKRILGRIKPGHVVLLHDDREHAATITQQIITQADKMGYEIVSPDQLFGLQPYQTHA